MKNILITGGAGFVGSNIAIRLKQELGAINVVALDNLKRRGSELNIARLKSNGVEFVHGDVRNKSDIIAAGEFDVLIECSAEPSVLAGYSSSPDYLIDTNLNGLINCLEAARVYKSKVIFLSTSRVYSIKQLNSVIVKETNTRYEISEKQNVPGCSAKGISEDFSLAAPRSIYGATKLCGELMFQEYMDAYGIEGVINRCGVIAGPWQMGKTDQGFVCLWVARHLLGEELKYIGFEGKGKQVRDVLHIDDLVDLIKIQLGEMKKISGAIFNVGGGAGVSTSLLELTALCSKITGNNTKVGIEKQTRQADIKLYITDNTKIEKTVGWKPKRSMDTVVNDTFLWLRDNKNVKEILRGAA